MPEVSKEIRTNAAIRLCEEGLSLRFVSSKPVELILVGCLALERHVFKKCGEVCSDYQAAIDQKCNDIARMKNEGTNYTLMLDIMLVYRLRLIIK